MQQKTSKPKAVGRPKDHDKDNKVATSAERNTLPGERRKTYIVNIELSEKISEIAHQDRTTVKSVVNDAFICMVDKWESEKGTLVLPKKK